MWVSTITNLGEKLLSKTLSGNNINITAVKAGTGLVDVTKLIKQTDIISLKQSLKIVSYKTVDNSNTITVLLENIYLESGYKLQQIGFYAEDDEYGTILFAIAQNDEGKEIPSKTETPIYCVSFDFNFSFQTDTNMTAEIDQTVFITNSYFNEKYNDLVESISQNANAITETNNIISDEWVAGKTYSVGEYCIYNNSLWKCKVQNNVAPTEGSNWTMVSVTDEINSLNTNLGSIKKEYFTENYRAIWLDPGVHIVIIDYSISGTGSIGISIYNFNKSITYGHSHNLNSPSGVRGNIVRIIEIEPIESNQVGIYVTGTLTSIGAQITAVRIK